jgi:hypothetical protein
MMKLTRKRKHHIDYNYKLEGAKLEFFNNIKYLGVNISSDLRWEKHVMKCTSKTNRVLGLLKRNLHLCSKEVKETGLPQLCTTNIRIRRHSMGSTLYLSGRTT